MTKYYSRKFVRQPGKRSVKAMLSSSVSKIADMALEAGALDYKAFISGSAEDKKKADRYFDRVFNATIRIRRFIDRM